MATEAATRARENIDFAEQMPEDARNTEITSTSVLPQVKVALQLMLTKWRDPGDKPVILTKKNFGAEAAIRTAIDTLGEQAWETWQPLVSRETSLDPRGYLESRRHTSEMTRRFDALMRGLVDARPKTGTLEFAAIARDGRLAQQAGVLTDIMRGNRLLTGAGASAWRLAPPDPFGPLAGGVWPSRRPMQAALS